MDVELGDVLQWTEYGAFYRVGNVTGWVEDDQIRAILQHAFKHPLKDPQPQPYLRVTKSACLTARRGRPLAQRAPP